VSPEIEDLEGGYRVRFELPAGSYATVVLAELTGEGGDLPEASEATPETG
jgi:tRNA(Glu) U13 pseudouridine synthase TruD